jgi:PncC family amidohydrolase
MWDSNSKLAEQAARTARRLEAKRCRLVLAESCTGGLASAALATIPGISHWHCGSAVTYREQTKVDWLGVSAAAIALATAVSSEVSRQMAMGALTRTGEAHLSASITGHLGPNAPAGLDGVIFLALARREKQRIVIEATSRHTLHQTGRVERLHEAATLLLRTVALHLE